ncbi:MAG: type I 3-dehydroquinate dehydratase [Candidatus Methanodesulfokora washburnensis]|jgi:3-dehydroquinate dehydratase type I
MNPMICISASGEEAPVVARTYPEFLVEARLDLGGELDPLSDFRERLIITVRRAEEGGGWRKREEERLSFLMRALDISPRYVDIEVMSPIYNIVLKEARKRGIGVIASFHDFNGMDLTALRRARSLASEADILKVAVMSSSIADSIEMMKFVLESGMPTIGICMGEKGIITRYAAPLLGSPFTYASPKPLAPGQPRPEELMGVWRTWGLI